MRERYGTHARTVFATIAALGIFVIWALALSRPSHAVEPGEVLPDAALEQRARALSAKLRCLVCQNQSIDDSNAPLAKDLRLVVRERLVTGETDQQVLSYVVARYGEFVLLTPPFKVSTLLLWLAPALCLIGIGYALLKVAGALGGRAQPTLAAAMSDRLSPSEERRLAELLEPADKSAAKPTNQT